MTKTTYILLTLGILIGVITGKEYSIKVDKLFVSDHELYTIAFRNARDTKKCDDTIVINNYDPPYLYIGISGKNIDYKTGIM